MSNPGDRIHPFRVGYDNLVEQLCRHEGYRKHPYKCTAGKLTIGIGRNLDDVGLTRAESLYLLGNDINTATESARRLVSNFDSLSDTRKAVLINMALNLGHSRLRGFRNFRKALGNQDFDRAAAEMLDSKWARKDVGPRAIELANQMRTDQWA